MIVSGRYIANEIREIRYGRRMPAIDRDASFFASDPLLQIVVQQACAHYRETRDAACIYPPVSRSTWKPIFSRMQNRCRDRDLPSREEILIPAENREDPVERGSSFSEREILNFPEIPSCARVKVYRHSLHWSHRHGEAIIRRTCARKWRDTEMRSKMS